MSEFDDIVKQMDADLFLGMGERSIFNGHSVCQTILGRDVVRVNDYGEALRNSYEITSINNETGEIRKGHTFRLPDGLYTVTDIVANDGFVTVSAVNRG